MRIGIIGAGNIGATLARKWSAAGYGIYLANSRGPDSIKGLAEEIGASPVSVEDAVRGADVLVVSIPQGQIPRLPKNLFADLPQNAVVVDTGNYYPHVRDETIEPIEAGMPESQWVAEQIGRPVIKAFNSILAQSLAEKGTEAGADDRIALPVSGNDTDAKRIVIGLVNESGFGGVDAGSLADSWRQQPGTPAYCTDLQADELRQALSAAERDSAPQKRDLALKKLGEAGSQLANEDVVKLNRSIF
jgi:8-hydroxy-5-deazaflavin:NADPH oxidoreductase